MWQIFYIQAHQLADDRANEARRERLAHEATRIQSPSGPRFGGLRRGGAIVAAGIARRLDECVAREELLGSDDRVGAAG